MKVRPKRGARVIDRWFPGWGVGIVRVVLKTRIKVEFGHETMTYDNAHVQFLELAPS